MGMSTLPTNMKGVFFPLAGMGDKPQKRRQSPPSKLIEVRIMAGVFGACRMYLDPYFTLRKQHEAIRKGICRLTTLKSNLAEHHHVQYR